MNDLLRALTTTLKLIVFVAVTYPSYGQSAAQLLQDTAAYYRTLTGYEIDGHSNVKIPNSPWQWNGEIKLIGPHRDITDDGAVTIASGGAQIRALRPFMSDPDAGGPEPQASMPFAIFGRFDHIADSVVTVEQIGSESLQLNGKTVQCSILRVNYTPSTYEHSHPEQITYWIDPSRHLVLKDVLTFEAGRAIPQALWTVTYDSLTFNRPTPQWVLDMANIPQLTERKDWIGKQAPDFSLVDRAGTAVSLSSMKGKVVLLDFWSITCVPCKLEMPALLDVAHLYPVEGVVLLGISFDPKTKSQHWLDSNQYDLRNLTDLDFAASDAYQVHGIPALVMIGADGKVKRYWDGSVSKADIQTALDRMLRK